MNTVAIAVNLAGGPIAAAKACGKSRQAVDKWIARGVLPRTDYTGETTYALMLADAAAARGEEFAFDASALLNGTLFERSPKAGEAAA